MKTSSIVFFCATVAMAQGCQQFPYQRVPAETAAIQQFNTAFEAQSLEDLRLASSEKFEHEALRRSDALDDLAFLNLPKGELEVLEIQNVNESEKRVQVAVGETKQKLLYQLRLNPETKTWEVDDIFMKQRQSGVIDTRTVTEQMDLLMTVRDFMEATAQQDRQLVLDSMTTDFRGIMASVPEKTFDRLTTKVAGRSTSKKLDPEAQMDGDQALVRLHRLSGELLLTFKLEDGTWKIDNLAVESRDDNYDIPNMRKTVASMQVGANFLRAYAAGRREELQKLSTPKFYKNSLEYAELSSFPLAVDELLDEDFQVRAQGRIATILIPWGQNTVSIDLARDEFKDSIDKAEQYLVEEVTLFEGQQQKQMSAVFVSQARMQVFANAIREGRFDIVKRMSTPDFVQKVWSQFDPAFTDSLPLNELRQGLPQILSSDYRGKLTQFHVRHGDQLVTYHLRDWNGEQLIDDVTMSTPGYPESLKETLAVMIPVQKFLSGIHQGSLKEVQAASSDDFNLLVWRHLAALPPSASAVEVACRQPVKRLELRETDADLEFAGAGQTSHVRLKLQKERWVIDEVQVATTGPSPQVADFKQVLRRQLATGELRSANAILYSGRDNTSTGIKQVSFEEDALPRTTSADLQEMPVRQQPPKMLPPEQLPTDGMQLDQLPALDVPREGAPPSELSEMNPAEPEIIRAHGESPFKRTARKISPMTPIWKQ